MTDDDVRAALRRAIDDAGAVTRWAREHGFSQPYVAHVLDGRKPPSDRILAALGLERRVTIQPTKGAHHG